MVREVRVSPDRAMVAIRSDAAVDAWNAWGVMNAIHGGHWSSSDGVADWTILVVPEPEPEPQP